MNGVLSMFVCSEAVFTGLRGAGAKFVSGPAGDNLVAGRRLFGKRGILASMVGRVPPGKQTRRLDGSRVEPANQFTGESTRLRNLSSHNFPKNKARCEHKTPGREFANERAVGEL